MGRTGIEWRKREDLLRRLRLRSSRRQAGKKASGDEESVELHDVLLRKFLKGMCLSRCW
jgi:hypothetical protein